MEIRAQQVIYGIAEAIAAHNLLRFVRDHNDEERLRMIAGATMAGLGYVFGPTIEERIRSFDGTVDEATKQRAIYAVGGAALGGFLGRDIGAKAIVAVGDSVQRNLLVKPEEKDHDHKPGGLTTILSAGWLGYSLFLDGKTPEEQRRHLWGLGSGVIGYLYAPDVLEKIANMPIGERDSDDAVQIYRTGGTALGAMAGGVLGWYKGPELFSHKAIPERSA
jgi:hypothetical protein